MNGGKLNIRFASIIDFDEEAYPLKRSTIIYLSGCPLNCPYCNEAPLVNPVSFGEKPVEYFIDHLKSVSEATEALVLTGGEPLMQANALSGLCESAKSLGFSVKIETSGYYAEALNQLLPFVDYVSMDLKNELVPEKYARSCGFPNAEVLLSNVLRSLTYLEKRGQGVFKEFSLTVVPGLNDSPEVVKSLTRYLSPYCDRFVLRPYSPTGELLTNDYPDAPSKEKMRELEIYAKRYVKSVVVE